MRPSSFRFYQVGFYLLLMLSSTLIFLIPKHSDQASSESVFSFQKSKESPPKPNSEPPTIVSREESPQSSTQPQTELTKQDKLKLLTDFTGNPSISIGIRIFEPNSDTISPDFAKLFELSSTQTDHLNELLANTREKLLAERKKYSQSEIREDGSVSIAINPFLESGEDIMNAFYGRLEQSLGPTKLAIIEKISEHQINRHFQNFGAEIAQYTIHTEAIGDGKKIFKFTRRTEQEHGYATSSGSYLELEAYNSNAKELLTLITPEALEFLETQPPADMPPNEAPP